MTPHLIVAPILLPMFAAALMLLLGDRRRRAQAAVGVLACGLNLALAAVLLQSVHRGRMPGAIGVYLPANWDVPFGIVLALDRLTALMLLLAALVALGALLFALARWHRAGMYFHPLFQLQLMGLNGAFLTADLFNLFVFFEIMLAASYGLLLHGSGRERVKSALHYIAFNLAASLLFLIGVAVLYGVTGTLNLADIARKLPHIPDADRGLLHAGAAILALAFLGKAALWPLGFWLAPAYAAASAPVAALFALLTKVGVYAVLRLWTLFFPATAGASALFGADALVWGGLATLAFGAIGVLASQHPGRLTAFSVIVSSGTLLAAIGFAQSALTAGALFYLIGSTLGTSAMFLLVELVERSRQAGDEPLYEVRADGATFGFPLWRAEPPQDTNLDDDAQALIGKAIPAAMAFLGMSFIACALLIAGLPPLTGFVAKFALLSALLAPAAPMSAAAWALMALVIGSGLLATIGWSRAGIRLFWAPHERAAPRLRVIECAPIVALLLVCAGLVVQAEAVLRYTRAAAQALHEPAGYVDAVLAARARPGPGTRGRSAAGVGRTAMKRLLPAPLLSAALFAIWLLLNRSTSAGHLLLAAVVALVLPLLTAPLRPLAVRMRRPGVLLGLILAVGIDVLRSNLDVARGVLRARRHAPRSAFVTVPLELREPHALAALAVITTVVPGTVWCELASDRSALRLHVFDLDDEAAFIAHYKTRYERPLLEIFR